MTPHCGKSILAVECNHAGTAASRAARPTFQQDVKLNPAPARGRVCALNPNVSKHDGSKTPFPSACAPSAFTPRFTTRRPWTPAFRAVAPTLRRDVMSPCYPRGRTGAGGSDPADSVVVRQLPLWFVGHGGIREDLHSEADEAGCGSGSIRV